MNKQVPMSQFKDFKTKKNSSFKVTLFCILLIQLLAFTASFAQTTPAAETTPAAPATQIVKGSIKDNATGETLIGANVLYAEGKGVITDIDGNFELKLPDGDYTLTISYVGYAPITQKIKVAGKPVTVPSLSMASTTLTTVEVVADIAKERETPVAVSSVNALKLKEELAGRDIPMVLNSTPGVYATQSGGGAGDARITIRGFNQANIAVLIDGIPVNDMENGAVYWSNWSGLGGITRSIQVQRGLGASKLAIGSVGGTMNTITKGIEDKAGISVQEDIGSFNSNKQTFSFNTGRLKHGWGVTGAVSKESSDGYADETWSKITSYFFKVEKQLGNHMLSFNTSGAPQSHGQRSSAMPVQVYDKKFAAQHGGDTVTYAASSSLNTVERGLKFNQDWGYAGLGVVNTKVNKFYKPLYSLRDFWTVNDKLYISTVAYASFGTGGGTSNAFTTNSLGDFDKNGQQNYTYSFQKNTGSIPGTTAIDQTYSPTLNKSTNYIQLAENNHKWFGVLSSANYKINSNLTYTGGLDLRTYTGYHDYRVYNLIGGDYVVDSKNKNMPQLTYTLNPDGTYSYQNASYVMKQVGDKVGSTYYTDYEGHVNWAGVFNQLEYKKDKWSAFITASFSETGYMRVDNAARKDLQLDNGNNYYQALGWGDTAYYDASKNKLVINAFNKTAGTLANTHYTNVHTIGDTTYIGTQKLYKAQTYTGSSKEAKTSASKWNYYLGYVIKGGANYNINKMMNVYANFGTISKVQPFNNVFGDYNKPLADVKNQNIMSVEVGYGARYKLFAANVNTYYTKWLNKPLDFPGTFSTSDASYAYNINGLTEIHKGIEADIAYNPLPNLTIEGLASIADWRYASADSVKAYDANGNRAVTLYYSAIGVHVGNAAQLQYGGSVRYTIFKNFWVKAQYVYFDKNYAAFNPVGTAGQALTNSQPSADISKLIPLTNQQGALIDNRNRDSWRMPGYGILDLHAGYSFKFQGANLTLMLHVLNALNTVYIADATNNYYPSRVGGNYDFSINNASVFFGLPRRYMASIRVDF